MIEYHPHSLCRWISPQKMDPINYNTSFEEWSPPSDPWNFDESGIFQNDDLNDFGHQSSAPVAPAGQSPSSYSTPYYSTQDSAPDHSVNASNYRSRLPHTYASAPKQHVPPQIRELFPDLFNTPSGAVGMQTDYSSSFDIEGLESDFDNLPEFPEAFNLDFGVDPNGATIGPHPKQDSSPSVRAADINAQGYTVAQMAQSPSEMGKNRDHHQQQHLELPPGFPFANTQFLDVMTPEVADVEVFAYQEQQAGEKFQQTSLQQSDYALPQGMLQGHNSAHHALNLAPTQQQSIMQLGNHGTNRRANSTTHTSGEAPIYERYHYQNFNFDLGQMAQQQLSSRQVAGAEHRAFQSNVVSQRALSRMGNPSPESQQAPGFSSFIQQDHESSSVMGSSGSSPSSASPINQTTPTKPASKRKASASIAPSNKKAKTADSAKAQTVSERALAIFASIAEPSDEDRPGYSKHAFASLREAKEHLARTSDTVKYHSLRIQRDNVHVLSDQDLKNFAKNLFDVIPDWPGTLTEVHTTIEGKKLEYLNERHPKRLELVQKKMAHSEARKDVSANIEVLIDHVKTLHTKGIPMADIELSNFSERQVAHDTIDPSKVKTKLSGYKVDHESTFLLRLGRILEIVKINKWVAYDVIEGTNLLILAAAPVPYHEKKFDNNAHNGMKKEANDEGRKVLKAKGESP